MKSTQSKKGFTIIEVVLVLAIAALIFLIVFLAVPALQRGQRDTQRRNDIGRATAAIQQFQSNNRGNLPTNAQLTGGTFTTGYLTNGNATFADPTTGNNYAFQATAVAAPASVGGNAGDGNIYFRTGVTCPTTTANFTTGGGRNIAFVINLETGGQYCQSI